MNYHFTSTKTTKSKKSNNMKCHQGYGVTEILMLLVEYKLGQLYKTVQVSHKIKHTATLRQHFHS